MTRDALWPFALDRYGRPGVEAAMLALQDDHGQCVPLLLWALWLAESGRPATKHALAQGATLARAWQDAAVAPLRDLRRRLRLPGPGAKSRERLRQGVKALELDAERMLLEMLEQASPAPSGVAASPADALADAVRAWGGEAPDHLLAELAARAGSDGR